MKRSNALRIIMVVLSIAMIAVGVVLAALAASHYAGSAMVFVFFTISCFLLPCLIAPKPRSYGYGFFAVFFFLGFWPKSAMHAIWATPFLEAVGDFSGAPDQWDEALIAASCGALGVAVARIIQLIVARSRIHSSAPQVFSQTPLWYVNHWRSVWIVSLTAMLIVNVANYYYAFYKIGVNPLLILPLHLTIIVSWLINIGFALWMVTLISWEINRRSPVHPALLASPLVEAFLSSTSAMSRGIFVFHAVPYMIAISVDATTLDKERRSRLIRQMVSWLIALFLISVSIVFWLRLPSMHGEDIFVQPRTDILKVYQSDIATQLPALFLKRWTGLEGVLAVQAFEKRGTGRFINVMTESPTAGVNSIFQQIAKAEFNRSDPTKTYLTNAGPLALLYLSDSLPAVFAGMFAIGLILIFSDAIALRWSGNTLLVAVAGAGLANVIAQTNFAYLTFVFLIQLWVTVGMISLLQHSLPAIDARK